MELTVFVEPMNGRFRASTSHPVAMETDGASRDEALQRLQELAKHRLAGGEVLQVPVENSVSSHPWMRFAGIWKEHPDFDQFQNNVQEYRRNLDAAETPQ